jgi:enoyl-[acyl-carrier protein] reductase II
MDPKSYFSSNRICQIFGIEYPIIQAGMIWCSGWELASAVSNSGGLGLLGSGSMYPDVLKHHIQKCKQATKNPFGVNLPLIYPQIEEHIKVILEEKVKIVFSSAGNPKTWTETLKKEGIKVCHVVSSLKFGLKSQEYGVDAIVGEGFEAGGHNGIDETTTFCLIPPLSENLNIPVIAAGGIASGKAMLAALALGAEGVQIGSRFAATRESSAHQNFKDSIVRTGEGGTKLSLKELTPVRLIKNTFYEKIMSEKRSGADLNRLKEILGKGRAKKGMFEGDLDEGELEIGQVSSMIENIPSASRVVQGLVDEFFEIKKSI